MEIHKELIAPDFTGQEYLETTMPYEWLAGFQDDPFSFRQKLEQMKADAARKGIRAFMSLWSSYCQSQQLTTMQPGTAADFTDFPEQPLRLNTGGKYICEEDGVKINRFGAELCICLHPILPVKRLINIDTGEEKLEIAFYKGESWRSIIVNKADIASSTQILQLAAYGIMVNTENAKLLSTYLLEMEQLNYLENDGFDFIPEQRSVSRLGWTDQQAFSPYVKDLIFDGENSFRHIFDAVKSTGDREAWILAMKKLRAERGAGRIFLAASFASVLIEPCGLLPFFLHAWGSTETGKTVGLMVAASVWASPKVGEYVATFNSTAVGQELFAGFLNSLPLCLDELQIQSSAGLKDFDKIVYQLAEGVGRVRGSKTGGLQRQNRWRNCILSSGEHPISSSGSGGGAINRILQMEVEEKIYPDLPDLCRIIVQNHGYAGREFVEHLQMPGGLDHARELQQSFYEKLLNGSSTEKQAASAAALLAADAIATELFFQDGNALTIEDMAAVMTSKDEVDANRRALQFIFDLVAANPDRFKENAGGELWGQITDTGDTKRILILKMVFDRELMNAGFNSTAFLAWANRRNLLITNTGRRTLKARISGNAVNTVCIDKKKAEELTSLGISEDFETCNEEIPF